MKRKNLFSERTQYLKFQKFLFQLSFFLFLHFLFFISYAISQGEINTVYSDCYQILSGQKGGFKSFNLRITIHNKKELKNLFSQERFKKYTDSLYLEDFIKRYHTHFKEKVNLVFDQYIRLLNGILNEEKKPKNEYKNEEGLIRFAKQNFGNNVTDVDIENTIKAVRTFLNREAFDLLNWPKRKSLRDPFKYEHLRVSILLISLLTEKILNEQGEPKGEYQFLNGLAKFAEEFFQGNPKRAFDTLSIFLKKNTFIKLRWNSLNSTVDQLEKLKHFILHELFDQQHELNQKYIGIDGQLEVANQFFDGNLSETYNNFLVLVKKSFLKKLGWQKFNGSVDEYEKTKWIVQNVLFNQDGTPNSKYMGKKGLISFVEEVDLFDGDFRKAFTNVSAVLVLEKYKFRELGWKQFFGDLSELKKLQLILRSAFFDQDGNLNPKYRGMDGLALLAQDNYGGDMRKAFLNVSFLLGDANILRQLGWRAYFPAVLEYKRLKQLIQSVLLDKDGNPNLKYRGMDGLALFAEQYLEGNMKKVFFYVLTINEDLIRDLLWRSFFGFTSDYGVLKSFVFNELLNKNGSPNLQYVNMDGFLRFIQRVQGDLNKLTQHVPYVYYSISSLLDKEIFLQFKWNKFKGSTFQFQEMSEIIQKSSLFSEDGNPNPEYRGENGLIRFAKEYFKMSKINLAFFKKLLSILGQEHFKDFGWEWMHFSKESTL